MIVAGDLVLLAAGFGLVRLVCRGEWPFGVVGGLGISFLAGTAALAFAVTVLGALGLSLWPALPALAALAVAGAARGAPRPLPVGASLAGAAALLAGARLVAAAASSRVVLNDEYAIWGLRGRALALADRLDPRVFDNAAAQYQHLDYPLLVPALVGWADRWASGTPDGVAPVQIALMAAAMLAVVAWAVTRVAGRLAGLAAALLALSPTLFAVYSQRVLADVPLTALGLTALLLVVVSLREDDDRLLAVAAIAAAGALYTKNEGALFGLPPLLLALLITRRRAPAFALAGAVAAYLPWVAWTRAHGLHSDVVNRRTVEPGRMLDNLDRLGPIWEGMTAHWPGPAVLIPLAVLAALLATRRGHGRVVALVAGSAALALAGLVFVYVASPLDVQRHVAESADRVQLYPALVVAVSLPLLAGLSRSSTRS